MFLLVMVYGLEMLAGFFYFCMNDLETAWGSLCSEKGCLTVFKFINWLSAVSLSLIHLQVNNEKRKTKKTAKERKR